MKRKDEFNFTKGLNVIFGPNASGKSTLLTLLARTMHCEQGGYSKITQSSMRQMTRDNMFLKKGESRGYEGYDIVHDGQPVFYMSAEKLAQDLRRPFDDDFFGQDLEARFSTKSVNSGSKIIYAMHTLSENLESTKSIEGKDFRKRVNDLWQDIFDNATRILLDKKLRKSKVTIILDEPDRSLDYKNQLELWNGLEAASKKLQIIVASHCIFALNRKNANYMETKRGYLKGYTRAIEGHF